MKIEIEDIVALIGISLMVIIVGFMAYSVITEESDDGRPGWANEMAKQLDEKGGRIDYYGDAVRDYIGATPVFTVVITADQDVYANAQGIVIKNDSGMIQIPYERVYAIYPTGGVMA